VEHQTHSFVPINRKKSLETFLFILNLNKNNKIFLPIFSTNIWLILCDHFSYDEKEILRQNLSVV
jgi:hypothetical protein